VKYWHGLQAWQEKADGNKNDLANNATTLIDYFDDPDDYDSDSDADYEEEEDTVPNYGTNSGTPSTNSGTTTATSNDPYDTDYSDIAESDDDDADYTMAPEPKSMYHMYIEVQDEAGYISDLTENEWKTDEFLLDKKREYRPMYDSDYDNKEYIRDGSGRHRHVRLRRGRRRRLQ
jgi:hypothetical protein